MRSNEILRCGESSWMRLALPGRHGRRLKALVVAGAESGPAAPAMYLRLWPPLLVRLLRSAGRADRLNDRADSFDFGFAAAKATFEVMRVLPQGSVRANGNVCSADPASRAVRRCL